MNHNKSYGAWWFLNVSQNDFKLAYNGHEFKMLVDCQNVAIPRFKGLPDKYRLVLNSYRMIIF